MINPIISIGEQVVITEDKITKKKVAKKGVKVANGVDDSISSGGEENGLDVYDEEDGEEDSEDGDMPDEFYDEELESGDGGEDDGEDDYIELS